MTNKFVVFVGYRVIVEAGTIGNAVALAKDAGKIEIKPSAAVEKMEPFWIAEALGRNPTCIHGVPILTHVIVPSFNTTDDPRCEKCPANRDGKCHTNIFLAKL